MEMPSAPLRTQSYTSEGGYEVFIHSNSDEALCMLLAGADNFGLEHGKGEKAIEWMNSYAEKNKLKFDARLAGNTMQTIKFGSFELFSWSGEWSTARNIVKKVSGKLGIKTIEAGYHEKRDLISAMFGSSSEFAKVYSSGRLAGNLELVKKAGRWAAQAESFA
jgi:hypothetical protein